MRRRVSNVPPCRALVLPGLVAAERPSLRTVGENEAVRNLDHRRRQETLSSDGGDGGGLSLHPLGVPRAGSIIAKPSARRSLLVQQPGCPPELQTATPQATNRNAGADVGKEKPSGSERQGNWGGFWMWGFIWLAAGARLRVRFRRDRLGDQVADAPIRAVNDLATDVTNIVVLPYPIAEAQAPGTRVCSCRCPLPRVLGHRRQLPAQSL